MNNYGIHENPYEAPRSQGNYMPQQNNEVLSFGSWLGILSVCTFIPLVGLILTIVLAFNKNASLKNWARAMLTWTVIVLVLTFTLIYIIGNTA